MKIRSIQSVVFDAADSAVIDCECLPRQSVPYIAKLAVQKTFRGAWLDGSHVAGRDMIVRSIVSIYTGCLSPTAQAVDRLYRLSANAWLGTQYDSSTVNGVEVITPAIPGGLPLNAAQAGLSLTETSRRTRYVVENGLLGITSPGLTDNRAFRDILQIIADKEAGGLLDDEMLAELGKIALAVV